MNKRLKKKQLTRQPSKKEHIKYWSRAYRKLSIQYSELDKENYDMVDLAVKQLMSNVKLEDEIKDLKQQLEVTQDKLKRTELHNVALKQELEESRKPWIKKAFGRG